VVFYPASNARKFRENFCGIFGERDSTDVLRLAGQVL
jgi:hypothetical protein